MLGKWYSQREQLVGDFAQLLEMVEAAWLDPHIDREAPSLLGQSGHVVDESWRAEMLATANDLGWEWDELRVKSKPGRQSATEPARRLALAVVVLAAYKTGVPTIEQIAHQLGWEWNEGTRKTIERLVRDARDAVTEESA